MTDEKGKNDVSVKVQEIITCMFAYIYWLDTKLVTGVFFRLSKYQDISKNLSILLFTFQYPT